MTKWMFIICLVVLPVSISADIVNLAPAQREYAAGETIVLKTNLDFEKVSEKVWDTYLIFRDMRKAPVYITVGKNQMTPAPLGMLPPEIKLRPMDWSQEAPVKISIQLCEPNTEKVFATSETTIVIRPQAKKALSLASQKLQLVQETSDKVHRSYSNYKQFDSRWKYNKMGQHNGTTIGRSGCAMVSAGNIYRIDPATLNRKLQGNGGYSGNLLKWNYVSSSYYGSGSISDSLFGSYHVIANVGGHFVLLTGKKSSGYYYSHDPGKSSNPVYSRSQCYSVRLYR